MAIVTVKTVGEKIATQDDGEHEGRNSEEIFGDAHEHVIDPAAIISGEGAEHHADKCRGEGCPRTRSRARRRRRARCRPMMSRPDTSGAQRKLAERWSRKVARPCRRDLRDRAADRGRLRPTRSPGGSGRRARRGYDDSGARMPASGSSLDDPRVDQPIDQIDGDVATTTTATTRTGCRAAN